MLARQGAKEVRERQAAVAAGTTRQRMGCAAAAMPGGDPSVAGGLARLRHALASVNRKAQPRRWWFRALALGDALVGPGDCDREARLREATALFHALSRSLARWGKRPAGLAGAMRLRLGHTYRELAGFGFYDGLAKAIYYYGEAVRLYAAEHDSHAAGLAHLWLAEAYSSRTTGRTATNVERWVWHCRQALLALTQDQDPLIWAWCQQRLALALKSRVRGDPRRNATEAIECHRNALRVYTWQDHPANWARTHYELARAYHDCEPVGLDRSLSLAAQHFEHALRVYGRHSSPERWADIQYRLASVHFRRASGDHRGNLKLSARKARASLTIFTRGEFVGEWAAANVHLGLVHRRLAEMSEECGRGVAIKHIRTATRHLEAALAVISREDSPIMWATVHRELGAAYGNRVLAGRPEARSPCVRHYEKALQALAAIDFPKDRARVLRDLGAALLASGRSNDALARFDEALALAGHLTVEDRAEVLANRERALRALGRSHEATVAPRKDR